MEAPTLLRLGAAAAILAAGGGTCAWLLRVEAPPPPAPVAAASAPKLHVAGHELPEGEDRVGKALDYVRKYATGEVKLRLPDGKLVPISRADLGLEIDRLRLAEFVTDASAADGIVAKARHAKQIEGPVEVPLPLTVSSERALSRLLDIKARVDSPPQDAAINLETRTVRAEKVGFQLDVYGTLARLESAFRKGQTTVDADVQPLQPKRLAKELESVKFDEVLGFFETRYSSVGPSKDRTYNLRLAASKLDGLVLMPGEVFDFNAVVGPRDEAHGYRVAPVIAQGELVDGLGGGTCQISGTLHAAAFFAGLEIVERYPHSRPSSYLTLGLDATVSYPNITYRFRNDFDFPIVLHEKVAGGVVRAEILGPARKHTVSYFRRIDEILPFEEIERETEKLPKGERVVTQRGVPGFVSTASRLVRNGAFGERTKWREKYPPTTQIVAVGIGPEDKKPALKKDSHDEYTVDEYLVVTQGPPTRPSDLASGVVWNGVDGRTGEKGWIKKLGLEKTPLDDESDEDDEKGAKKKGDEKKGDEKKGDEKKGDEKKGDEKKGDKKPKDKPKEKEKGGKPGGAPGAGGEPTPPKKTTKKKDSKG
jgi:vancomycin resistance protein YoaR